MCFIIQVLILVPHLIQLVIHDPKEVKVLVMIYAKRKNEIFNLH